MKTLQQLAIMALLLTLVISGARAQAIGEIISYQGKLTNADGTPVANGTYSATIKINENGEEKASQTLSVATLGGVFSTFINIGALKFDAAKNYTLTVTANGVTSTQAIASVPVAQTAKIASSVTGPGAMPIGGVAMWWSDGTLPEGWAVCDGSTVSNAVSPLNGKALPDLRDKFVRGVGNSNLQATPVAGGSDTKTLTVEQIPAHNHGVNDPSHSHSAGVSIAWGTAGENAGWGRLDANGGNPAQGWAGWTNHSHTGISIQSTGGGQPFNIVPAFIGLVYIIRIY